MSLRAPLVSDVLSLADSEVLRIEVGADGGLSVAFAAACVSRSVDGGPMQGGFLKPLSMVLTQARVQGALSECVGLIGEGEWRIEGVASDDAHGRRTLALPWRIDRPLTLRLSFRLGGELVIEAASARCEAAPQARFFESLAC